MIRRSTWIVLGMFIVVLAGFWYLQGPGEAILSGTATPTAKAEEMLVDLAEGQIQAVQVESNDGQTVRLERDLSGQWTLVLPQIEPTDTTQADLIVRQLVDLQIQSRVGQGDGSAFGLEPPKQVITLETSSGQNQVLEVGNVTPIENGMYVRKAGSVFVVDQNAIGLVLELLTNPPVLATETPVVVETIPPVGTVQP